MVATPERYQVRLGATALPPLPALRSAPEPRPFFLMRGHVLSQTTRVWGAAPSGGGPLNAEAKSDYWAVKQNWQDDKRIPEAFFHARAEGVEGIPRLEMHEVISSTRTVFDRVRPCITGYYEFDFTIPNPGSPLTPRFISGTPTNVLHRILIRLVFDEVGRPLSEIEGPLHLLQVALSILIILKRLHERGILHRDVSLGNILISTKVKGSGLLIDLGLSELVLSEESGGNSGGDAPLSEPHHQITGTLPYMACDILDRRLEIPPVQHELRFDYESVFWVLLHFCLLYREAPVKKPIILHSTPQTATALNEARRTLAGLESSDVHRVVLEKYYILSGGVPDVGGTYAALMPFLTRFGRMCHDGITKNSNPCHRKIDDVINMTEEEIAKLEKAISAQLLRPNAEGKRAHEELDTEGGRGVAELGNTDQTESSERHKIRRID